VDTLTELSLFSGGGGGLLATQHLLGFRTICYCEIKRQSQKQLVARIKDKLLDDAPIWDDVRTFDGRPWNGLVDVLTAGFPCQSYSNAGKRLGAKDPRNLWPDTIRIARECGAKWILLENVSALLTFNYYGRILADLAESGYNARYECVSAFDVGAAHLRERLWIIANTHSGRRSKQAYVKKIQRDRGRHVSDGLPGWEAESKMDRVAHGLARGMGQQLESLGDGQVPHALAEAWFRMVSEKKNSK
jgi:DNA (cytosine-5)-methyltransferase 1